MTEPLKIPKRWDSAFSLIKDFIPDAIMAGGCLRDLDNDVKAKDVDVFVPQISGTTEDLDKIVKYLNGHGVGVHIKDYAMYKAWSSAFRITGIVDALFDGMPPVQIIVGPFQPETITDTFDFGSSMITYDGKDVKKNAHYLLDKSAKLFRVQRGSRQDIQRSVERYTRIKPRYPDWKFGISSNVWNTP